MWEMFKDAAKDLFTGWSKLLRTRSESFALDFLVEKLFVMLALVMCMLTAAFYLMCPIAVVAYICGYLDMPCGLALVFAAIFALMNIPVLAKLIPYINKKLDNRKDESH